jgi:hypothetical protein
MYAQPPPLPQMGEVTLPADSPPVADIGLILHDRFRMDSNILFAHTSISWLSNGVWIFLLHRKVRRCPTKRLRGSTSHGILAIF